MLYIDEREYPLSVQIFGGDKETLVEATLSLWKKIRKRRLLILTWVALSIK